MVTDYATIVRLFCLSRNELLRPSRAYFGLLRGWQAPSAWSHFDKAHTGAKDSASKANEKADELARNFAAGWRCATGPAEHEHATMSALAQKVAKHAGQALILFPSINEIALK